MLVHEAVTPAAPAPSKMSTCTTCHGKGIVECKCENYGHDHWARCPACGGAQP